MTKEGKTYQRPRVNMDPLWTPPYGDECSVPTALSNSSKVQLIRNNFDDTDEELQLALALSLSESEYYTQSTAIEENTMIEETAANDATGIIEDNINEDNNIIKPTIIGFKRKNVEFPPLDAVLYDSEDDSWEQLPDLTAWPTVDGSTWSSKVIERDAPFAQPVRVSSVVVCLPGGGGAAEERRLVEEQLENGRNTGRCTTGLGDDIELMLESAELEQDYQLYKAAGNGSSRRRKSKRGRGNGRGDDNDGQHRERDKKYAGELLLSYGDLRKVPGVLQALVALTTRRKQCASCKKRVPPLDH